MRLKYCRIIVIFILMTAAISGSFPIYGAPQGGIIALNSTFGSDPETTRAFNWQTAAAGDGILQYETGGENDVFDESTAFSVKAGQSVFSTDDGKRYVHKVSITGLIPGASYLYRVSDGSGGYSGIYHFATEPDGISRFSFLTFSDTQASTQEQYSEYFANSLRKALKEYPGAAFVLHTGDIVDNGSSEKNQWNYLFGAIRDILPNLAFEPVIGNHEGMFGGAANFLNHFNIPETHYSYVYGDCLFLVLDTNGDMQSQIAWMEATVNANNTVKWKIAALHKGPYGGMHSNDSDVVAIRKELPSAFDRCGVNLVLEGHDHAYMRSYFMSGGQVADNSGTYGVFKNPDGIVYIVSGACGPKSYNLYPRFWSAASWLPPQSKTNEPGEKLFDEINVTADYIEVNIFTTDMQKIDYLKIEKD